LGVPFGDTSNTIIVGAFPIWRQLVRSPNNLVECSTKQPTHSRARPPLPAAVVCRGHAQLSEDEARRIAANIASINKLSELVQKR
jgi:hypothetical protein